MDRGLTQATDIIREAFSDVNPDTTVREFYETIMGRLGDAAFERFTEWLNQYQTEEVSI